MSSDDAAQQEPLVFPSNFLWGAATASYQIEGACAADGKGRSWWDDFAHTRGKTYGKHHGDVACDHYHRLEEDVQSIKEMGLQAYRFSLSWSRLFPDGTVSSENAAGVDFYRRLLQQLKDKGIKAMVTLYHWDLPSALAAQGGWLSEASPGWFAAFAVRCYELFDGLVDTWITFNEPWCMCALGYGSGVHAPGLSTSPGIEPYLAAHHVLLAHGLAYKAYKARWRRSIGITLNCEWREPAGPAHADAVARELEFALGWFAEPIFLTGDYPAVMRERCGERLPAFTPEQSAMIKGSSDFFGFNWYSARIASEPGLTSVATSLPSLIRMAAGEPFGLSGVLSAQLRAGWSKRGSGNYFADIGSVPSFRRSWALTHMTWPVVPWALARFLVYITTKYRPQGGIVITENGVAVAGEDDVQAALDTRPGRPGARRVSYVRAHLVAIHRAIAAGADVRGYFLWSLMDNFEWAFGYAKRFGALHVNYETLQRTPKPVVSWYRQMIAANAVVPSASEAKLDPFSKEAVDSRVDDW